MTGDDKYSLLNRDNLLQHFQIQLSIKPKKFSQFFLDFRNVDSIFIILKKKMTLIASVLFNRGTPKNVIR